LAEGEKLPRVEEKADAASVPKSGWRNTEFRAICRLEKEPRSFCRKKKGAEEAPSKGFSIPGRDTDATHLSFEGRTRGKELPYGISAQLEKIYERGGGQDPLRGRRDQTSLDPIRPFSRGGRVLVLKKGAPSSEKGKFRKRDSSAMNISFWGVTFL